MKMDKMTQKLLLKQIKTRAVEFGYKVSSYAMFSKIGENFVSIDHGILNSTIFDYSITIKKYSYDDIFWDVMNMADNKKAPVSLRAIGAFAAPSITIFADKIPLSDDIDSIVQTFFDTVVMHVNDFLKNNQVSDFIFSNKNLPHGPLWKCLEYIDRKEIASAIEVAKREIASGDKDGGFENEGKGFFEWVLYQYSGMDK